MPCPSARTKYFLSWTNLKLSRTKFLSRVKNSIFSFKINSKWNFLIGRVSKNHFHLQMLILNNFGNQKMDFLTLDNIFVLDNLTIVLDKKYFVRADGRGKIGQSHFRLKTQVKTKLKNSSRIFQTAKISKLKYKLELAWVFWKSTFNIILDNIAYCNHFLVLLRIDRW